MNGCAACDDTGWVSGATGVRRCSCTARTIRAQSLSRAGIPQRYQSKRFEDYDGRKSESMANALLICRRFVDEWPTNRHLGMTLSGPVGVGKTHLVCVVLMECSARWGASVAFVDLPELFARIKASFGAGGATEAEMLKPILQADILAIDEVDAARQSDWNFAMTEQIINARYNDDRSMLVTTNSVVQPPGWTAPRQGQAKPQIVNGEGSFADLARSLAPATAMRRETLGDRIGARMFSRVTEMTRVLEMEGPDQRAAAGQRRMG